jgi:U2 small nuclear ribonucleoprotein A'
MSKLDYDLLLTVESFIDPVGSRVLNLRGLKIQRIENLVLTKDAHDTIDFTDNDILKLGNFSLMLNVQTLLVANNRIQKMDLHLSEYLPNLKNLILTNNALSELGDLDPLQGLTSLVHLSLVDNIVANRQYYRQYIIHKIPSVRILDFRKVTPMERKQVRELFKGDGLKLLEELGKKSVVNEKEILKKKATPYMQQSQADQKKIREAIKNAKTLNEIQILEQQLAGGVVNF